MKGKARLGAGFLKLSNAPSLTPGNTIGITEYEGLGEIVNTEEGRVRGW